MSEVYHEEHMLDRAAMLAMRGLIALQPAADLGPSGRAAFDQLMEKTPQADSVNYEAAEINGVAGWWCRLPDPTPGAAILYLHGGGYVVGSSHAYRNFVGQIALRVGVDAFIPSYGLAPERPFPAAVEDGDATYRGLATAGVSKILLVGDSAGGGLALVLAARMAKAAEDGSVPRPVASAVMSPWTDLALTSESMGSRARHDPLLARGALAASSHAYLRGNDPADPQASPIFGDLAGLPPAILHVGEDEILLDDARRYADRASAAGSAADIHVWQGMIHVFPANLSLLHAAREALDILGEFLRHHLNR